MSERYRPDATMGTANNVARLRTFVTQVDQLIGSVPSEVWLLPQIKVRLTELVRHDDWLDEQFAQPDPVHYRQYLLYCDPAERFSIVSFVWGPGQRTPIHDHTVWGAIGVLRGAEQAESYTRDAAGRLTSLGCRTLTVGEVDVVSPRQGDIHRVANASPDASAVSIHVYGGNIGAIARHAYDEATHAAKRFVSGYANSVLALDPDGKPAELKYCAVRLERAG